MGLFDSIFGGSFRDPPREKWDWIVDTIHEKLSTERHIFFDACVKILSMAEVSIANRTMPSRVELAITVYQLHLARELIATNQYVRPEDSNEFVSLLYSRACKFGSILERDEFVHRYWAKDEQGRMGREILCFCMDVASYITGNPNPLLEAGLLMEITIVRFTLVAQLAVATTFGDRKEAQDLLAAAKKL